MTLKITISIKENCRDQTLDDNNETQDSLNLLMRVPLFAGFHKEVQKKMKIRVGGNGATEACNIASLSLCEDVRQIVILDYIE